MTRAYEGVGTIRARIRLRASSRTTSLPVAVRAVELSGARVPEIGVAEELLRMDPLYVTSPHLAERRVAESCSLGRPQPRGQAVSPDVASQTGRGRGAWGSMLRPSNDRAPSMAPAGLAPHSWPSPI